MDEKDYSTKKNTARLYKVAMLVSSKRCMTGIIFATALYKRKGTLGPDQLEAAENLLNLEFPW